MNNLRMVMNKSSQLITAILFAAIFSICYAQYYEFRKANYKARFQPMETINLYEEIIQKYPETEYAAESQLRIGMVYKRLGDFNKAHEAWQKTIELYPNAKGVIYTYVDIAAKYELQDIFEDIHPDVLRKFILNYPESGLTCKAQYEIGDFFHSQKKFEEAVHEYQILIENYLESEYTERAKKYITDYVTIRNAEIKLDKMITMQEKSDQVAEHLFRVGKMYYDFIHKYPIYIEVFLDLIPAFDRFRQLINEYPDCEWADDAEYYILTCAAGASFEGGDVTRTPIHVKKFKDFIKKYPSSEFAHELQYKIGEILYLYVYPIGDSCDINLFLYNIIIYTGIEPWKIYGTNPKKYLERAIDAYDAVIQNYPDSEYVPESRKMIQKLQYSIKQLEETIAKAPLVEIRGKVEIDDDINFWTISDIPGRKKYIVVGENIDNIQYFDEKIVKALGIMGPSIGIYIHSSFKKSIQWRAFYIMSIEAE